MAVDEGTGGCGGIWVGGERAGRADKADEGAGVVLGARSVLERRRPAAGVVKVVGGREWERMNEAEWADAGESEPMSPPRSGAGESRIVGGCGRGFGGFGDGSGGVVVALPSPSSLAAALLTGWPVPRPVPPEPECAPWCLAMSALKTLPMGDDVSACAVAGRALKRRWGMLLLGTRCARSMGNGCSAQSADRVQRAGQRIRSLLYYTGSLARR